MKRRLVVGFLWICHLVGALLGGVLLYAKDHPASDLYKMLTDAGFHL